MIAQNITKEQLIEAANKVGVSLNLTTKTQNGLTHRVKVNLEDKKYQRRGFHNNRKVHAVCWHGFRDFLRACYELSPNAKFKTSVATYKHAGDFEKNFPITGYKNIGSQAFPMYYQNACDCR